MNWSLKYLFQFIELVKPLTEGLFGIVQVQKQERRKVLRGIFVEFHRLVFGYANTKVLDYHLKVALTGDLL